MTISDSVWKKRCQAGLAKRSSRLIPVAVAAFMRRTSAFSVLMFCILIVATGQHPLKGRTHPKENKEQRTSRAIQPLPAPLSVESLRGFMTAPPFRRWLSLVAVYAL